MNKEKEQELKERYKDRGELTVNFILFAYDHYGELLDFSDTYVENQNEETILDIKDYCRVKVVPRVFMLQPGTFSYNIIERAISFVEKVRERRKDVTILPKESIYVNNGVHMVFYCKKHNKKYTSKPGNILFGKVACKECNVENKSESKRRTTLEATQKKLDEKYGKDRFTVLVDDSLNDIELIKKSGREYNRIIIHIKCNKCQEIIICPLSSLYKFLTGEIKSLPCKRCEEEIKNKDRLNYFVNKFNKLNIEEKRYLDFDFSEAYLKSVKVGKHLSGKIFNIKCNKCGEHFDMLYGNLIHAVSCPHCMKSSGELVIEGWLRENNISFNSQVRILNDDIIKLGHPRGLVIDFMIKFNERTYWVEYHGEQHYVYCNHFKDDVNDFYVQLKRDEFVSDYCKKNNISFIELPWTIKSKELVSILDDLLINNIPHPYEFPKIRLNRKKEFPDTGLHRSEFLKQNGLL